VEFGLNLSISKKKQTEDDRWPNAKLTPFNGVMFIGPHRICSSHGGSGHPSNTWFLGLTRVLNPNGISIGLTVFPGLITVTDRQTDRPRYSVGNNTQHIHVVLRCGLIIIMSTFAYRKIKVLKCANRLYFCSKLYCIVLYLFENATNAAKNKFTIQRNNH